MPDAFFTIGHSTRTPSEFVDLLRAPQVRQIVDVRTVPRSRANPQFNYDTLPGTLAAHQIGYEHIFELGGLRGRQGALGASPNLLWENRSFRNYADYALTEPFRAGLTHLRMLGHARRCGIMCAEAVWWRCHRRIIADYLIVAGESVFHILSPGRIEAARLTLGAQRRSEDTLVYPTGPAPVGD
jgi:uncharacterized protein (DUF488 family)